MGEVATGDMKEYFDSENILVTCQNERIYFDNETIADLKTSQDLVSPRHLGCWLAWEEASAGMELLRADAMAAGGQWFGDRERIKR